MYEVMAGPWGQGTGLEVARLGRAHLTFFNELYLSSLNSGEWQRVGYLLWRVYPKHHLFLHVIEDQIALSGIRRDSYGDHSWLLIDC